MRQISPALIATASIVLLLSGCAMTPSTASTAPAEHSATTAAREGAIELEWRAPKDRLDGAPLQASEIAGYRIYIGAEPGQPSRMVEVASPHQTQQLLRGLQPGEDYYVAISTVDRQGQESPKSKEIRLAAEPVTDAQIARSERLQGQSQRASLD